MSSKRLRASEPNRANDALTYFVERFELHGAGFAVELVGVAYQSFERGDGIKDA